MHREKGGIREAGKRASVFPGLGWNEESAGEKELVLDSVRNEGE